MSSVIPNLVISDFDGTLYNFKKIDNKIIQDVFSDHKVVLVIDKILWKINALGIFGNSMIGLKLRLFIYSLLTFNLTYRHVYISYAVMYKRLAKKKYKRKLWLIRQIEKKGYTFIILTNNRFTRDMDTEHIIYTSKKRRVLKEYPPEYLIGDNFWDDYRNSPKGTKYVHVGNGIVSKFKNIKKINNFYEIFNVI